ncbi:YihY/virulence factor BrkB family protein [soil metagenome]|nr:YihY/virulence factor BrkB family protein [Trueperaceae bacterium]
MFDRLRGLTRTPAFAFAASFYGRLGDAKVFMLGAALAYYAAFSLGPLLLLLGGWLAVLLRGRPELSQALQAALTDLLTQVMPLTDDADALIQTSLDLILSQLGEGALLRTIFSVIVLLWASSSFFTSLQLALEMIFDVREQRGFVRKRLVALLLVLAVAIFLIVEVIGAALGDAMIQTWSTIEVWAESIDLPLPDAVLPGGFSPLRLVATVLVFALCFRYLPRRHTDWVAATLGAGFSTVVLVLMRTFLTATFSIDRFNLVYGVITGVVVLLLWLYLAMIGFLLGAVLAAEVARWRRRDRAGGTEAVPADPG